MTNDGVSSANLWHAPHATDLTGPLNALVTVPGSKSLTNRYLLLAGLAHEPSVVRGALQSRDSQLMIDALTTLGATITASPDGTEVHVTPLTVSADIGDVTLDCGLAGTVMRFIPAVAALVRGNVTIDGDEGARARPMGPVITALEDLGVAITRHSGEFLPFTVHGTGQVTGGTVTVDASASSQFISGLLLSAARFDQGLTVRHNGSRVPSLPHIDMTCDVLSELGVIASSAASGAWTVEAGPIRGGEVYVEPDLSNATPFMAAALVLGGTVTIPGWPLKTTQPGALAPSIFERMGARCDINERGLTITGNGVIHGLGHLDLSAAGELAPTFAALAALASSPTEIHGIAHLRGHETDRLAALSGEINRMGGNCEQHEDGLLITPVPLHGGVFQTYHDHRMATAGAIIGLRVTDVAVENIDTTAKTLPGFATMWRDMLNTAGTAS
ncbi:3-phosphoshikimate 1-carboxyvinyltransferase [Jonesia quinghaiensis]|uniref:3-phosphoshikimate 1-carboxyvinyltransferase n=1 Tax=Jonesia quinghaiensis TaxID=262806 RepID=UPI000418AB3A|nr:3-phosphoshikimate 1-carboxyvinyltransferase [Jonesia quinghaiensis]